MKLPVWAALALSAAGCSLIIPLDYTGGVGGSAGTGGAGASNGGSSGVGNAPQGGTAQGAEAGVGNESGNPQGGAGLEGGTGGATSPGGTDSGGRGGTAGTEGGTSGTGGAGGSSMGGEDTGGEAGGGAAGTSGGGAGGTAGRGGRGGTGGGGMGGTAGCSFDLTSNPMHCGSCTNACPSGNECIDSECVASPCDKLGCTTVLQPINNGDGPRRENIGTGDVCVEVASYTPNAGKLPGINCWNTGNGRVVEVNDVAVACGGDKLLSMPKRKGGYCFHAGPGDYDTAGFVMPYNPSDSCCKAPNGGTGGT